MSYKRISPISITEGGTGAKTLTGVLTGNGTSAITANAVTQYNVLVGGASNAVSSITNGTTGQIFTANTGANPGWAAAPAAGITTINGNSGSVTGSTVTIQTLYSTLKFVGSGTTLSLDTSGDANGNILMGFPGTLTSGVANTGYGNDAMQFLTTGNQNCAFGKYALRTNSSGNGNQNVAVGWQAGYQGISGNYNTAVGSNSMGGAVVSGTGNVGVGINSLLNITSDSYNVGVGDGAGQTLAGGSGYNTLLGYAAGYKITTGTYNVNIGSIAGGNYTSTESSNICINASGTAAESHVLRIGAGTGTSTQQINSAYICGINGITVTGSAVLVSSSDQLGIAVSSRKYKDNIQDMGDASEALYKLRPTTFTYKESTETRYGLIAEEVAEVLPNLVVYDKSGDPQTVMYHELPALLLNEIQKLRKEIDELKGK